MYFAKSHNFEGRMSYMRGQAVTTMILILTICVFYLRLDIILQAVGFPKEVSDLTWYCAWASMPHIIICSYNDCFRSYLISLSLQNVFHISNIITIVLGIPGNWFFIIYLEWGLVGAGAIKFL
jgi:Na+-driven multidrug efflux pump